MTIQELRADIAKLDTGIDFQRELLKRLERDRSVKQRQLNSALDPVARLPLELSSDIFLRSLPPFPEPGDPDVPILLLNICNAWTDIALSTPSLWAAIHIVFPGGLFPSTQRLKTFVPIWLRRADNRPLSISLSGANFDYDVVSVIWSHAQQFKHLEISDIQSDDDDDDVLTTTPLWKGRIPGPMPSLETLTIHGAQLSPHDILDLLRLAPNLIECTLEPVVRIDVDEILVLPKLRRLMFGERATAPSYDFEILDRLSLPGLETLLANAIPDILLSFLRRSSPPLRELVLGKDSYFPLPAECLHLVPALPSEAVFAGLAESPALLPHLNALVLHVTVYVISDSFWAALHRALLARRAEFQLVQITVLGRLPDSKMPSPDLIAAFRALALDGVQIQLGLTREIWHGVGDPETWNHTFA
ncbi:hypothetical protein DFH08DRAFT_905730 [Mycena albidolilacea]|uniref:F-box domain-containing protein n=1 Tax=Mycena albidolilacea TaxID=1033008 RepID=A0AAD6YZ92_9AGAR|nr:hypothetical protein DFH08DRAFT_905730 [Mycena albidolilacea]